MKKRNLRKPIITALEQRVLFDGAAVATAVDVLDNSNFSSTESSKTTSNDATSNSAENSVHEVQAVQSFETNRREVTFVDVTVKDYQTLVDGVGAGTEVYLVSSLDEIKTTLSSQTNIDAIHILSHGNTGEITVGNDVLNSDTLDDNAQLLETMKNSLSENGDILLYGCNVASDGTGQEFINEIATLTQADVAASDDTTGNSALGGNWVLEKSSGNIETDSLGIEAYDGELVTTTMFDFSTETITGSGTKNSFIIRDPSTNYALKFTTTDTNSDPWAVFQTLDDIDAGLNTSYVGKYLYISNILAGETITITADMNNDGVFGDAFKINSFNFSDPSFTGGDYAMKPNGVVAKQEILNVSGLPEDIKSFSPTTPSNFDGITRLEILSETYGIIIDNLEIDLPTAVVADTTPPIFDITPTTSNVTATTVDLSASLDEAGKIYYVVVADGATAPTIAQIKAGQDSTGASALKSGNSDVTTTPFTGTYNITGLSANTAYDIYVVGQDDEGTPNVMATASKVDVNTLAPSTHIYYTTSGSSISSPAEINDALRIINIDGTGSTSLVSQLVVIPADLVIDSKTNTAFVMDNSTKSIYKVDLSTNTASLFLDISSQTSSVSATGMAVDSINGYLYYATTGTSTSTIETNDALRRINIDGTNNVTLIDNLVGIPGDIVLDQKNNAIFIMDNMTKSIYKVNLSNNTSSLFLDISSQTSSITATGMVIDPINDYLYYTTTGTSTVSPTETNDALRRINIDGTNNVTLVNNLVGIPGEISLDLKNNNIYVFDNLTKSIYKVNLSTNTVSLFQDISSQTSSITTTGMVISDGTIPTFDSINSIPSDNGTDVNTSANLQLKFSEVIIKGYSGNFVIRDVTSNSVIETISFNDTRITGWETNTLVINPTAIFAGNHNISVQWSFGTMQDYYGNFVVANTTDTLYNFTTILSGPTVSAATGTYNDTSANDTFTNKTGTISATASSGSITGYGISTGTTSGSTDVGGIIYDVSKAGTYGTLYVKSSDGSYVYVPTSDSVINATTSTVTDVFTIQATDGAGTGDGTLTITVNGVNDTPVLSAPSDGNYTDTSATDTFTNTTGTLSATDRDTGATLTYGISTGTTGGSTLIGGVTYDVSKAGTYGTLYVVSTGVDKGKYAYVPTANAINALTSNATDTFTVSASDGSLSNTQTFTVNITGVNDTPIASNKTITINEDTPTLLTVSDFGFSDVDTGSALSSVKITSLASDGTLEYNNGTWTAVTLNQVITAADITGNKLRFNPSLNENGTAYATFNFTVNDGTVDSSAKTITYNVTAVNDAPTVANAITDQNASVSNAFSFTIPSNSFADVDTSDTLTYTAQLVDSSGNLVNSGTLPSWLTFNAGTRTFSGTPALSDAGTIYLKVKATDNGTGNLNVTDTFTITVNSGPTVGAITASYTDTAANNTFSNTTGTISATPSSGSITGYGISAGTIGGSTLIGGVTYDVSKAGTYGTLYVVSTGADKGKYAYVPTSDNVINATSSTVTDIFTVQATDSGGTTGNTLTITINGVNDTPVITSTATATAIDENIGAGQVVYTVASTDADTGDTLTYSLLSPVTITSASGGAVGYDGTQAIDNNANTKYFDWNNGFQNLEINLVLGSSTVVNGLYLRTASDAASFPTRNPASFTIEGSTDGTNFTTIATNVSLTQPGTVSGNSATSLNSSDYAEVVFANTTAYTYYKVTFTSDVGDLISYTEPYLQFSEIKLLQLANATTDGTFNINSTTGAVTLIGNPNFEAREQYSFTVVATDRSGATSTKVVTLGVNNVNEAPVISSTGTATAIDENSGAGQVVYTVTSTDVDASATVSYSLSGTDANLFTINSTTGAVTLTANPNYENKSSYSFNVIATDNGTLTDTKAVTLAINNVNEAPVITSAATATAIDENSGAGQVVYTVTSTDVDASATVSYSLSGTDANLFTINSTTGAVTLTANPNYENKSSYSFNVIATDNGTLTDTKAVTLAINNVNEAPVLSAPSAGSYTDTSATDTFTNANTTGTLSATDIDTGTTLSYGISSGTIGGSTLIGGITYDVSKVGTYGTLYVKSSDGSYVYVPNANAINALTSNVTDTFTVRASDGSLSNTQTFTVNITGVNDTPSAADKTITINEDTPTLLTVSDFGFTDVDTGNTLASVKITSLASDGVLEYNNGTWTAVTSNQVITATDITNGKLRFNPSLNENGASYATFQFTVNDGTLDSTAKTITYNVTAVNDIPVLDSSKSPVMSSILGDIGIPENGTTTNSTLVSDLINSSNLANFSDVEGDLAGIAITNINTSKGTLYYSLDGGTNWLTTSNVSETSALLLYADTNTRLYFSPSANQTANVSDAITFKAWDRTGGYNNGDTGINTTTNFTDSNGIFAPGNTGIYNATIRGDYAFIADGGSGGGIHIVDISNINNPTLVKFVDTSDQAHEVVVVGNYAYVATEDGGFSVVDISNLNNASERVTRPLFNDSAASGLVIDGSYAYVSNNTESGGNGGLVIFNISNPLAPVQVGSLVMDYPWQIAKSGNYVYIAAQTGSMKVVDVSNPANPSLVTTYSGVTTVRDISIEGNYAYLACGVDGVKIFDISNPNSPTLVSTYSDNGNNVNGVSVSGDYVYVADYTKNIKVLNITDKANPTLKTTLTTTANVSTVEIYGNTIAANMVNYGMTFFGVASPTQNAFSSEVDTVSINITFHNHAPVLSAPSVGSYTDTAANDTFSNTTGTLSATDRDSGTTLTYGIDTGTTGSTVVGSITYDVSKAGTYGTLYVKSSDGSYVYVPNANAINALTSNATDTFTVRASDGSLSNAQTLTINLTATNDTPVLSAPSVGSYTDTAANDTFSNTTGTLSATDRDSGTTLTYGIDTGTTGSTVVGSITYDVSKAGTYGTLYVKSSDGSYVYVPNANAINALTSNATDTFTVRASDGSLSNAQTLTINLTATNDTPVLSAPSVGSYTDTAANDTFSNTTGTLSATDRDSGTTLTYGIDTGTTGSTVVGSITYDVSKAGTYGTLYVKSSDGSYVYVPNANAINALTSNATDTFTVRASDGSLSNAQTLTINLTATNDTPVLSAPSVGSYTDTAANDTFSNTTGTLSATDRDSGTTLTYGIDTGTTGSTVVGSITYDVSKAGTYGTLYVKSSDGSYVYVPNANAINALTSNATDTFTVRASDGSLSNAQTLTINLTATNDTPLGNVIISGIPTQGETLTATNNITDAEGMGTVSYQWYADGVLINGATNPTYTLTQNEVNKAITVIASYTDGFGASESVTSSATNSVENINDAPTVLNDNIDVKLAFGDSYSKNVSSLFNDIDFDNVFTYKATNLPLGLAIDPITGVISGRANSSGEFIVTIQVTDNGTPALSVSRTFKMTVVAPAQIEVPKTNVTEILSTSTTVNISNISVSTFTDTISLGTINNSPVKQSIDNVGMGYLNNNISNIQNNVPAKINNADSTVQTVSTARNNNGNYIEASASANVNVNGQVTFDKATQDSFSVVGIAIENMKVENNKLEIKVVDTSAAQNFVVTKTDGTALPAGISFDPKTGNISGSVPQNLDKLDITIKATNSDGTTRVLNIKVDLKKLKEANRTDAEKYIGFKEQLAMENQKLEGYGDYLVSLFV